MTMEVQEDVELLDAAESSKDGAKRMRRLLHPPKLGKPSTSAIHPTTSHLIYPSTSPAFAGHLLTPLFSPRAPRPLPTPPVLTPGRELSISPTGEWVVIFHPNPRIPNQVGEGGTLAIYRSSILSPISKPTTRTTVPLATFPLPTDVLAVHHLYPPKLHLPPPHGRSTARGSAPLAGYNSSQGPGLVVLTPTSLILLHPQLAGPPGGAPQYMMGMLTCPLHTRWHAAPGGSMPPETGWRVDHGWIGAVGGDDGVWVGWSRKGEVGVIRAEVGMSDGRPYFRTTPMPPSPGPKDLTQTDGEGSVGQPNARRTIQGMTFFALPDSVVPSPTTEGEDIAEEEERGKSKLPSREIIGASIVISEADFDIHRSCRTIIEVVGFEKREVELVEGFSEMSTSGEADAGARSWDWFTFPEILRSSTSPANTSILSLIPLPDIPPYTLSLAIVQQPAGVSLVHLDLCPSGSDTGWRTIGEGVPLELGNPSVALELVPSQAVYRGLRGLVSVVSKEEGATLVIMPSLSLAPDSPGEGAKGKVGALEDAAMGIVLAIRQGVSYADVVRVAFALAGKDGQKELAHDLLRRVHNIMQEDLAIDDGPQLHRLQVAIFGHVRDEGRTTAAELVKLYEASYLLNTAAYSSPTGGIAFDLDTVWSLLAIAEWVMAVSSSIFRSVVLYKGGIAWSGTTEATSESPRLLYILQPELRALLLRLLAQVKAFKTFLETLEEPIMQPESKYMPIGRRRDPRATILARERGRDLGVRDGVGVDVWGRVLEAIPALSSDLDAFAAYTTAYLTLEPSPLLSLPAVQPILETLPSPSSLLLSDPADTQCLYDGITFEPLQPATGVMIRCDRCAWATKSLGFDLDLGGGNGVPGVGGERVGEGWLAYVDWRKDREEGCGCGGTWVRESVGAGKR